MRNLEKVFNGIDWEMLRDQKRMLINLLNADMLSEEMQGSLNGILNLIDATQDAAGKDGYPVIFMSDPDEEIPDA